MAEVIRLDPFKNIIGVHWRDPNTETETAPTETESEPPPTDTDGIYPYFAIIQVLTGSDISTIMELTLAADQLVTFGVQRFAISPVPTAELFVRIELDRDLIDDWPSASGSPQSEPGFYLVASSAPIVWPLLDDGSPGYAQVFDPFGGSSWAELRYHWQIITIEQSPAYRWFPYIEELVPEIYREQFSTWVVP